MPTIILEQEGQEESRKQSLLIKPEQASTFLQLLSKKESQVSQQSNQEEKPHSLDFTDKFDSRAGYIFSKAEGDAKNSLRKGFSILRKWNEMEYQSGNLVRNGLFRFRFII